ncbi:MAG TPA: phosphate signaling complex protein PhoU [Acidimicrobiia bacterium]|nr:phosphate signaling complex protein PhoU [Acidimicrobiia bacterium]
MIQARRHFHEELDQLVGQLTSMAQLAGDAVGKAVHALLSGDVDLADLVVTEDQAVDDLYSSIHQAWLETMALQTPVAVDLRLMSAILHLVVTLERMGDQATNIAKIVRSIEGLPQEPMILEHLREMGDLVQPMVSTAMEAFVRRDLGMAMRLPEMDEPVNRLNRSMAREIANCGRDHDLLEWAVPMLMVSRALERVGDQAVDIGEQVAFLLTGEFQEFTRPDTDDGR